MKINLYTTYSSAIMLPPLMMSANREGCLDNKCGLIERHIGKYRPSFHKMEQYYTMIKHSKEVQTMLKNSCVPVFVFENVWQMADFLSPRLSYLHHHLTKWELTAINAVYQYVFECIRQDQFLKGVELMLLISTLREVKGRLRLFIFEYDPDFKKSFSKNYLYNLNKGVK